MRVNLNENIIGEIVTLRCCKRKKFGTKEAPRTKMASGYHYGGIFKLTK